MTSIIDQAWKINGVLSGDKTVWQNIQALSAACACWVTYDISSNKWAVIINKAGSSVASFNNSNIIGSITVSGSGITDMYNRVQIDFPHKDLIDNRDTIVDTLPAEELFPNEPTKLLSMTSDIINDPLQAEMIAVMELKQSRLDKIISFRTDFSKLSLKAGDIIDVTTTMYGFTNKKFRIITIEEADEANGAITLSITALEYSDSVYDFSDLTRYQRDRNTGIVSSSNNEVITGQSNGGVQVVSLNISTSEVQTKYNAYTAGGPLWTAFDGSYYQSGWVSGSPDTPPANSAIVASFYLPVACKCLLMLLQSPLSEFSFQFLDPTSNNFRERTQIKGYAPSAYGIYYNGEDGNSSTLLQANTSDWQTQNASFQIVNAQKGVYTFVITPLRTYDFNQRTAAYIQPYDFSIIPNGNGAGITISGYSFGSIVT